MTGSSDHLTQMWPSDDSASSARIRSHRRQRVRRSTLHHRSPTRRSGSLDSLVAKPERVQLRAPIERKARHAGQVTPAAHR
jgi:hypothetical protein